MEHRLSRVEAAPPSQQPFRQRRNVFKWHVRLSRDVNHQALRPGDTFLDVGANVGICTLLAASIVGPSGTLHAFERVGLALSHLRENTALNNLENVRVHELALSDREGKGRLAAGGDDCVASLVLESGDAASHDATTIECVTLDGYLADTHFAMAKRDIEGAEPIALRGALQHLAKDDPPVQRGEMDGNSKKYGEKTLDFIASLAEHGYDVSVYDATRNVIEFTDKPWLKGRPMCWRSAVTGDERCR